MKKMFIVLASNLLIGISLIGTAWAESPECTTASPDTWMPEQDFKEKALLLGYSTDGFTVTEGNCYALTKLDAVDANEMEYFDPVSGEPVIQ